jgi:hypothetical protein
MLGLIRQSVVGIEFESPDKALVRYGDAYPLVDSTGIPHLLPDGVVELVKKNGLWVIDIPAGMPASIRQILAKDFVMPDRSVISEEETFRILEAFASSRAPNEVAYKVEFAGSEAVQVSYHNGGFHGGGVAEIVRRDGRWTVARKVEPY